MEQKIVKQVRNVIQGPSFEERETGLSQELSLPHDVALRLDQAEKDAKVLVGQIDILADKLAQKAGYDSVPWFQLTV